MMLQVPIEGGYYSEFASNVTLPEHHLLIAIVNRALLDFFSSERKHQKSAKLFFYSKKCCPMTFLWCAEYLAEDPEFFVAAVRSVIENPNINVPRIALRQ